MLGNDTGEDTLAAHPFTLAPLSIGLAFIAFAVLDSSRPAEPIQPTKAKLDYAKVDYIFRKNHCSDCHSVSARASARLTLATYEGVMKGGNSGAAVKPGDSASSLLYQAISGDPPQMPPNRHSIRKEEIATIKQWIDEGAEDSDYGKAISRYYAATKEKKWDDALKACADISAMKIDGVPTDEFAVKASLIVYTALKNEDGWYAAARKAVDFRPLNTGLLNGIAWTIADPKTWLKVKDADLSLKAAQLAVEDSNRKSGLILDTLAWAYFLKGDKAKAIETEHEAMKCPDVTGDRLTSLQESLKAFGG